MNGCSKYSTKKINWLKGQLVKVRAMKPIKGNDFQALPKEHQIGMLFEVKGTCPATIPYAMLEEVGGGSIACIDLRYLVAVKDN